MTRRRITKPNEDNERLREVVHILERIREQRKQKYQDHHSNGKRFTLEEMEELVSTYRNARYRPEKSLLLSRDELLKLCDHLECTSLERNEVLLAAHYEPVGVQLRPDELNKLIDIYLNMMRYLPFPAYLVTRDFNVQGWNRHIQTLLGWEDSRIKHLRLAGRLNLLHLTFDRTLGVRDRMRAPGGSWEETALRNVYLFKVTNIHYRFDEWYTNLVTDLQKHDDFDRIWNETDILLGDRISRADYEIELEIAPSTLIRFRPLRMTYSFLESLFIVGWMPTDEKSREVLRAMNIPIPQPSDVYGTSQR
ncbi:MmyB family transcriptional regulator [Chloroflexus sp.]|uniref:MmyB family transcriptional regulator n=1 Tax=Chloroflexus sp. TaxID=1904827 RepID=UPI00260A570C|nr:hypothetical protein [uncultured Chloroflexus sp.]